MHDLRFLSAFLFLLEIAGCIHNLHQPPSVSLFSTLLPPSFFLSSISPSLLAIWLLQLCSLAYCRMCRCHQKLFTFQRFDAISQVYKVNWRHFAQPPRREQRDEVSTSYPKTVISSHHHSPWLHHPSCQSRIFDIVMMTDEHFISANV